MKKALFSLVLLSTLLVFSQPTGPIFPVRTSNTTGGFTIYDTNGIPFVVTMPSASIGSVIKTNFYNWGSNCIVAGAHTLYAVAAFNCSVTQGALLSVSDAPTIGSVGLQAIPPWPIAPTNAVFMDFGEYGTKFNVGIVVGLTTNSLAGVTTNVWSTNMAHFTVWYK